MDFSNNRIDTQRRTAVYVRISTSMQKTGRQVEELVTFAKENKLNFNEKKTCTFEEYDAVVQERKQTDFFEPYVFDVR